MSAPFKSGNQLLALLMPGDFALLEPHLEKTELPLRRQLELRGRPIEYIYFLDSGLASMVVSAGASHSVEVGIVGREGMTGLSILLASDCPIHETFIQTAGIGRRISAKQLGAATKQSPTLHNTFMRYAHTLVAQMAYTALANGRYKIEERLARWLLMAEDRADGNTIHLTHEFLALMLGARRAGVTNALNDLQKRGVVEVNRGSITVKNRIALEEAANGSYGIPESEYQKMLGSQI